MYRVRSHQFRFYGCTFFFVSISEFNVFLPGYSTLEIEVWDHDFLGFDEFIGSTAIDLDDRLFSERWNCLGADTAIEKEKLREVPSEWRSLWSPTSKRPQGRIHMWLDILDETVRIL